ncbi:B12-binding domain-containing radical SAM protein [Methylophaga sp. OBS3]|uniref:B12-binding domain-containing radical SAM protein n=1 Tax=Methylophaga sp. OBS3 TaxID=2991934 RepID=UPI0022543AD3|nr:DUF4080 domain-containing protein [Methylophaga sp. OBS3]MCX4190862.1 DUF4080 domain-containing protein [Methylophaga sp. OBS3]
MANTILLSTLNARFMHSAFGLRYLYANLGELQEHATIAEFTIQEQALTIAEQLLSHAPKVIGFSVYIWNVKETEAVVALIKTISPDIKIVLGGPEVSHQPDVPPVCELADYVISGPGEQDFRELCQQLLADESPAEKYIEGRATPLEELVLPYQFYDDEDIKNRLIYVEASRGCPFKCEFCLSALDKTSTAFPLDAFLSEMDLLWQRGVRNFKFIDRTFNLKVSTSVAILEFFLERMSDDLYLHFEVVPDNLPEKLQTVLKKFPPQSLQFEIGIQTFDTEIQTLISRRQDNNKSKHNILWLREQTGAHLHTDLIFGLPGDTLANFADSFDQLVALNPHEIQVGILKRLRGAPLNRHTENYQLRFNPQPPYNLLCSRDISFTDMQLVNRFARFWDLIGNSGRFMHSLPIILGDKAFERFMQVSEGLYSRTGQTAHIALKRLFELLYLVMTEDLGVTPELAEQTLLADYERNGIKGKADFVALPQLTKPARQGTANKRQRLHA